MYVSQPHIILTPMYTTFDAFNLMFIVIRNSSELEVSNGSASHLLTVTTTFTCIYPG